ncbi:MAG: 3-dehydroquinate dehydratase [Actinobacteria bacterium BACL4 MAG-120820-bin23]|uniref:type II 3-dehydroquinate dehydratase n=1 Tax=Candidatus Nanopelagicus sp. TaxID=2518620 RepID=UPI0007163F38|nr:MAG: 3-dehydroquinate dehydratase [Actinobacteria bacterium BACL4 MAG-121022-bin9]KRO50299.1 MAG: 3-dehydroquinate dehydratase [Actinobacteria bacterium BACL4 MAG-120820-bin23]KRO51619.1 MAG: 3-dehydroquinate dehydratase [Actinobacteria bacterium BACL4 MAG-121001-bin59]KRO92838.1 MAG: 3-dehydroquinate dehydratase [Actinobacteria bacterium BACL4 MAG-120507-bin0]HCP72580.1 type II 3-dehydroquinate dehydratase [Actinomycetota bacterium]
MKIMILNGPNLARLDLRDKDIYGNLSYEDLRKFIVDKAIALELEVDIRQSDSESEIVSWIHEAADNKMPMIINPAAFTHYSYAIRDAVSMLKAPAIEVHLSNPLSREEFRHTSVVSGVVQGTIAGFGAESYELALVAMQKLMN